MFFRILKKDMKRKKTTNMILLLFIILATMFVASGLNNVITVMNGTDYYFDQAGLGDYMIVTMGQNQENALENILKGSKEVEEFRIEKVIFGSADNLSTVEGDKVTCRNTTIFQSVKESKLKLFDTENQVISKVKQGHAYVSGDFMESNDFQAGDKVKIKIEDVEFGVILDGKAKDAFLGSSLMGNTRFILNQEDMKLLTKNEVISKNYHGQIAYIDCEDTEAVAELIGKAKEISAAFSGPRSMMKMCYVMDMVVAFITLVLSLCLIVVSLVVLKFSITFTISEEYREIGVMKAIGIGNFKIRSLYIIKYLILAVFGSGIGIFVSMPFGKLLLDSVSKNMVLGNDFGYRVNVLGGVLVIGIILMFAYLYTRGVKKLSPVDAVRSGQTGERYKKKSVYRIGNCHVSNSLYLAITDVLSSPKRFLTIIISFFLCTLLVLILVNTTNTMKSDRLIDTFSLKSDLYIVDVGEAMEYMKGSKEEFEEHLKEKEKELKQKGMDAKLSVEVEYKYCLTYEGKSYDLNFRQGLQTKARDYKYAKGSAPQNKNEIAVSTKVAEKLGAGIGDVVTIDFGTEKLNCMITAVYETMNHLGEVVRLHEDAPTEFNYVSGILQYQVCFQDKPGKEVIEQRKETLKKFYHNEDVMNAEEFCADCIGVVGTMETVQYLLLAIAMVVVILLTILMERSFIANEKSQIAILKALGFKDSMIISWHVYRFGIVAVISTLLAALCSIPVTELCITPIFGMMGADDISYYIDGLQIFVIYPGIVLLMTLFMTFVVSLYTKTIKSSDTASIE